MKIPLIEHSAIFQYHSILVHAALENDRMRKKTVAQYKQNIRYTIYRCIFCINLKHVHIGEIFPNDVGHPSSKLSSSRMMCGCTPQATRA